MLDALGDVAGDLPEGRVIAVGHSGAHRTLSMWLADERIDTIVLVDALYGEMPGLAAWLDGREGRRLIDVAVLTREWADELHAEIRDTVALRRIPAVGTSKHRKARVARVVYMRSQQDHMQLVTGGIALPRLLRALQLPLVAQTRKRSSHAM